MNKLIVLVAILLGLAFDPVTARGGIITTGNIQPSTIVEGFVWSPETAAPQTTGLVNLSIWEYQTTFSKTSTLVTWTFHVKFANNGGDFNGTLSVPAVGGPFTVSTGQIVNDLVGNGYTAYTASLTRKSDQLPLVAAFGGVHVPVVPEPSEYALFTGLGLFGFVAWRRRKLARSGSSDRRKP